MIKHMILTSLVFFSLLVCPPASAEMGCSSAAMSIPLHVPHEISTVRLSDLKLTAWNSIDATFLFENLATKEIDYLTIILKYQGKKRDFSLAVVYEAAPDIKQPSDYLIPAQRVQPLPHPILPGQKQWISGTSPYTPPECPELAQLIMLDIHFGDHSKLRWESSGWWTEPLLSDFPEYLSIPDSKDWSSGEYSFLAEISREGQVEDIVPTPPTERVPSGAISEALKKLTFFPSLEEGKPRAMGVILIVRIKRPGVEKGSSKRTAEEPKISRPVAIMLLHPRDSRETEWEFDFGRGWAYRTIRTYREY